MFAKLRSILYSTPIKSSLRNVGLTQAPVRPLKRTITTSVSLNHVTSRTLFRPTQSFMIQKCYSNSSTTITIPVATYDEVKNLPNHPKTYLIDVREPDELTQTGQIPTSINIPLGTVETAFSKNVSDEEFLKTYGRAKPKVSDEIIFHCKIGRRSQTASEKAAALGFSNVKNYKGSWDEWAQLEGLNK